MTGGMIAIIAAGVVAFTEMLTSLLSSASIHVANIMLGTTFFNYEGDENIFSVIEGLFGSGGIGNIDIARVVQFTALSLTIIITVVSVIESWMMSLQGEKSDNPVRILLRGVFAILLQFALFGFNSSGNNSWFNTTGLVYAFGDGLSALLAMFTKGFNSSGTALEAWSIGFNLDIPVQIVILMLSFAIFKGVVEAAVVFVERWLSTAVYVLFGPLACSCYASGKMKQSFSRWMTGVLTQFLTIFVTVFAWRLFISSMASLPGLYIGIAGYEAGLTSGGIEATNVILQNTIALASLSLVKNSEKIVNALGLQTIMTGQTAGEFAKGAQAFARNITDPFIRPLQHNFGQNTINTATRAAYNSAVARNGINSKSARIASGFMDPREKLAMRMGMLEDGAQVSKNDDGKYRPQAATNKEMLGRGKIQEMNASHRAVYETAAHNVSEALDKGPGTLISGQDAATIIGKTKATENIKIGANAYTAQTSKGIDGQLYSEQRQSKMGIGGLSSPEMRFTSPVELEKGESICLSENGKDCGLRINTDSAQRNLGGYYDYKVDDISSWSREQYIEDKMGSANMKQLSEVYSYSGGGQFDSNATILRYYDDNPDAQLIESSQVENYFKYAGEWQNIQNNVKEASEIKTNLIHQEHYDSYKIPDLVNANSDLQKGMFGKNESFIDGDEILEDASIKK